MQIDTNEAMQSSDEISVKDIIGKITQCYKYLLLKWFVIVVAAVIGGIIGLTYSIFEKPVYIAELSFALEDDKSSAGGLGAAMGLASQFGIDLGSAGGGGAFSGDNLLLLMKSRSMVEKTLLTSFKLNGKYQTLANLYIDFNNYRYKWNDDPSLAHITYRPNQGRSGFTLKQDSILGVFYLDLIKHNLSVDKVDKKLSVITVKVNSKNELFSKYFTETLVSTVSDFYIATKTKKSVKNVNILQRQTDSVRQELNAAITGVASSSDFNPNPNPALQILRVPSQRRQVDVQANQAILTQLVANLEISKVSLRKETPLIQIIDSPILPLEEQKVGKLKGIVIGSLIFGCLSVLCYCFRFMLKLTMDT